MNYEEYEDLNKAKKKILDLMKMKYSDPANVDAHEDDNSNADDSMAGLIKKLGIINGYMFQMLTFVRQLPDYEADEKVRFPLFEKDGVTPQVDQHGNVIYAKKETKTGNKITVEGALYFRSATSYVNFNQYVFSTVEIVQSINKTFEELIKNIGHVEPDTMNVFNEAITKYFTLFLEWQHVTTKGGGREFKVTINMGAGGQEKTNLQREYNLIVENTDKLDKYYTTVKQTYNYNGSSVGSTHDYTNDMGQAKNDDEE
jgi:hypothetical protein